MSETSSSNGYLLLLDSDIAAAATPPSLTPRDTVTADTSGTSVQCTVDATAGSPSVTGVTAIPVGGAPSVTFNNNAGVWTAQFPASAATNYSWKIEVTIDPPDRENDEKIVLDPLMIVRKTN